VRLRTRREAAGGQGPSRLAPPPPQGEGKAADGPTLGALFLSFLTIGSTSFGGGLLGWIRRELVERRRWIDDDACEGIDALFEPRFIFDSYANRPGKGTHAAVRRLRDYTRQVHSGQGGGWYLQLDIKNFFVSIHRPTLYAALKRRLQKHHAPQCVQRSAQ